MSLYPPFVRTMSIGSGSKEANDQIAEQKMTFVDDKRSFGTVLCPYFMILSGRNESGGIEVSANL